MVIELREEREGYGVDVFGESYAFTAILLAFPFVDHHADTLPLRLVLRVWREHAGIDGSGRRHGGSTKKLNPSKKACWVSRLGWDWIADTIRRGPTPCTYRIMQRNGRATRSNEKMRE
jgi:hypothetical protein